MSGYFEGDMIRPLGLVTLFFGYAEYELDQFLERLASTAALDPSWRQRTLGQKLGLLEEAVAAVEGSDRASLDALLREARCLFERRNSLVHSCIVAGGRVISSRSEVSEWHTSPDELTALAEQIFTWKERLSVYRWKKVEPLLQRQTLVEAARDELECTPSRKTKS